MVVCLPKKRLMLGTTIIAAKTRTTTKIKNSMTLNPRWLPKKPLPPFRRGILLAEALAVFIVFIISPVQSFYNSFRFGIIPLPGVSVKFCSVRAISSHANKQVSSINNQKIRNIEIRNNNQKLKSKYQNQDINFLSLVKRD